MQQPKNLSDKIGFTKPCWVYPINQVNPIWFTLPARLTCPEFIEGSSNGGGSAVEGR